MSDENNHSQIVGSASADARQHPRIQIFGWHGVNGDLNAGFFFILRGGYLERPQRIHRGLVVEETKLLGLCVNGWRLDSGCRHCSPNEQPPACELQALPMP